MGEYTSRPEQEPEVIRLQRQAEAQLSQLKATLNELDRARARHKARHASPEERRRGFRVIQGGAMAVGAAVIWAWEVARRPAVLIGASTSAVATGAFMTAPLVAPGTAAEPQPPPAVVSVVPVDQPTKTRPAVTSSVADEVIGAPSVIVPTPTAQPKPTVTSSPTPTPAVALPLPSPTVTATATVEPLVEIEVNAEDDAACVESGLVGLELAVCLNR